tara:strand:+ start:11040 stop:11441 length:402 start_codon:yes stop_codon:yes gene_type:complete
MNEVENIAEEAKNGSLFNQEEVKKEYDIEDIINFFIGDNIDNKSTLTAGRVYQKNKKNNLIETFFKLVTEEVSKMESKNNKDLDNSFFNLNKKILSNNVYNLKEIIKTYNIDEERLTYFLLGTLIQYMYESRS